MKKTKRLITISVALLLVGVLLMGGALLLGGEINRRSTHEVTHRAEGNFSSISVETGFAHIIVKSSPDESVYAVCDEDETITYTLKVVNESLLLEENDNRKWHDYIGIFFGERKVTLYLPARQYEKLSAESGSGSIRVAEKALSFEEASLRSGSGELFFSGNAEQLSLTSASGDILLASSEIKELLLTSSSGEIEVRNTEIRGSADIKASSGEISFDQCEGSALTIRSGSGDVELDRVNLSGKLEIMTSSGEIDLEYCDGGEITIESSSGDIEALLMSEKLFDVQTKSGALRYPASDQNGGLCWVRSNSGDIMIAVAP